MTSINKKYIHLLAALLTLTAGCADEPFPDAEYAANPDIVAFNAGVRAARISGTRGDEEQLYEPLELTAATGGEKLYLHTYETPVVGERPGQRGQTRGMQVTDVATLEEFHTDFMARAAYSDDGQVYIPWAKTHASAKGSDIWLPERKEYWPNGRELTFHAAAPSAEFNSLRNLSVSNGTMAFDYAAKKGNANNDAELQRDLLVATSTCDKAGSVAGRAPLKFHHALSSIKFAVRDVMGGEVVNIKIRNVYGAASCSYQADADGGNGTFSWSGHSHPETYSQDFNFKFADRMVSPADESADINIFETMPSKTFMLIPQEIPENAEVVITIRYDATSDMKGYTKELKAKILDNAITRWKAGYEYVYTISTSKENWVYVFKAYGNHTVPASWNVASGFFNERHAAVADPNSYDAKSNSHGSKEEDYNLNGNMIYVYSPSDDRHDKFGDNAYYRVISCRYRANNFNVIEDLPWEADYEIKGEQWRETSTGKYEYVEGRDVENDMGQTWITDGGAMQFKGVGSHDPQGELHDITFFAHHQMTDWPGDKWMDDNPERGTETAPWDLSTCGGSTTQWTANCYVIDRAGWYSFPLYYGNAIEDGKDNSSCYEYTGSESPTLKSFKNHNGYDITSGKIPSSLYGSASLVWADVYNSVSDVRLEGDRIVFKANVGNMQQGNVIIALKDTDDTIVWSWHIWINEHWLDPDDGVPDALKNPDGCFAFEPADVSGWRQRGDVLVETEGVSRRMAAYNLGWCDPKNVDYLFRPSKMHFVQYHKDGSTETGESAVLPIIQDGERVAYKYGNNTYYQWGRKDPMVGFVDHESTVKRNFGPTKYMMGAQRVPLSDGIKYPYIIYCEGKGGVDAVDDWTTQTNLNLWNNGSDLKSTGSNSIVKTIYDPCPAGYAVPPALILSFIGKANDGRYDNWGSDNKLPLTYFNGMVLDEYTYIVKRSKATGYDDEDVIWLTSTGQRWYCSDRTNLKNAGDNFNPNLVYLWSCTTRNNASKYEANCIALGLDNSDEKGNKLYCISAFFAARKSMARPIRPARQRP